MQTKHLVALVALAASAVGFAYFAWHPLFGSNGRLAAIKTVPDPVDYVLFDHLTYMAISRNVEEGLAAYVEPYTGSATSIYPSGYYWALGNLAVATDTSVVGTWNVLGIAISVGLVLMSAAWAWWAARGTIAYVLAAAPLFVATLGWVASGQFLNLYRDGTVLWPPFVLLNMGTAESLGMLMSLGTLLALTAMLATKDLRTRLILAGGVGILLGVLLHVHAYVAIFMAFAIVVTLVAHDATMRPDVRRYGIVFGAFALLLVLFSTEAIDPRPTTKMILLLAVLALGLTTRREWLKRMWRPAAAILVPAALLAIPMALRILESANDENGFFNVRQEQSAVRELSLPVGSVLFFELPIWLLLAGAIVSAWRLRTTDERRGAWLATLIAIPIVTLLLTFNEYWGADQEPYRFLPYGALLGAVVAFPWLWLAFSSGRATEWAAAAAAVVLLLATLPGTAHYAQAVDSKPAIDPPDAERAAYAEIANRIGPHELTLFDNCFASELTRVIGGPSAVAFHPGLAYPENVDEVVSVRDRLRNEGVLATRPELKDAGVKWFLTHTNCNGADRRQVVETLGEPEFVKPIPTPERFGHPAGSVYEVYRVG